MTRPLLVLTDHVACFGDTSEVGHRLDDPRVAELAAWFVEQAFEDEWLSRDSIARLFKTGQPALHAHHLPMRFSPNAAAGGQATVRAS